MTDLDKDKAVLAALKDRYFLLCSKERIGETHALTKEIDHLQTEIRKLQAKLNER